MTFAVSSIGDISFQGRNSDNPKIDVFSSVKAILESSDIVVANLENPLIEKTDGSAVVGKCTLRGSTGWAEVIKTSGINLVSLANNHVMDFGGTGLFSTMRALDSVGIHYVGAGKNSEDANKPLILNVSEKKIAVFARSSVIVSSPSYAGDNIPGVAYLNVDETVKLISECKKSVDYVILIMHWGIEDYEYPSPEQRNLAKKFIDSGVDLLLGHHPHVIQGIERIKNSLVHYSSGNFLFDEFSWTFINMEGEPQGTISTLSKKNREGMILKIEFDGSQLKYSSIQSRIETDGTVQIDENNRRINDFKILCQRLHWPAYKAWWRIYAACREFDLRILPLVNRKFNLNTIKKIRATHVKQLFSTLKRSMKITSEKSTNPYE